MQTKNIIAWTIVSLGICLTIGFTVWILKDGWPLFMLILIPFSFPEEDSNKEFLKRMIKGNINEPPKTPPPGPPPEVPRNIKIVTHEEVEKGLDEALQ